MNQLKAVKESSGQPIEITERLGDGSRMYLSIFQRSSTPRTLNSLLSIPTVDCYREAEELSYRDKFPDGFQCMIPEILDEQTL